MHTPKIDLSNHITLEFNKMPKKRALFTMLASVRARKPDNGNMPWLCFKRWKAAEFLEHQSPTMRQSAHVKRGTNGSGL